MTEVNLDRGAASQPSGGDRDQIEVLARWMSAIDRHESTPEDVIDRVAGVDEVAEKVSGCRIVQAEGTRREAVRFIEDDRGVGSVQEGASAGENRMFAALDVALDERGERQPTGGEQVIEAFHLALPLCDGADAPRRPIGQAGHRLVRRHEERGGFFAVSEAERV